MNSNDVQFEPMLNALRLGPMPLLQAALTLGCSDVHFNPLNESFVVTARLHGCLHTVCTLEHWRGKTLIQTLKAIGKMNLAETRQPQDARLTAGPLECRLATHPGMHGESLVVRLQSGQLSRTLNALGFDAHTIQSMIELVSPEQGMTLVCGATGSGKTTTLHALLNTLGDQAGRVATLEDPVEIVHPQALQTDLSNLPHLSFASGLRSLLRQDPDTLLIGEIRDSETALLALQAALTGHRVLASLHAPDAFGALGRLLELGVQLPALLNSLNGVVVQRLVRSQSGRKPVTEILQMQSLNKAELLACDSLVQLHSLVNSSCFNPFDQKRVEA
ncbi:GspE/PulE family protein [Limnobacter litoralis]|uniref:Bacterial type II secretion system protein E domain-containing protein n=1 Tax=Limnobacter litoralis TaxID=481366 RepID=A0ABQ5YXZ7_9BURK|nr:ATPase, T2SS/T4P/T4SS family [Limnobacter litoralis]GLR27377.1 hypothetical protein GCM10007875_24680 [Limnobacter litoralis]